MRKYLLILLFSVVALEPMPAISYHEHENIFPPGHKPNPTQWVIVGATAAAVYYTFSYFGYHPLPVLVFNIGVLSLIVAGNSRY